MNTDSLMSPHSASDGISKQHLDIPQREPQFDESTRELNNSVDSNKSDVHIVPANEPHTLNNAHVTLPHSPSRENHSIESTANNTYVDNSNSSLKNIRSDEGNEVSMVRIEATQKTEENQPFLDTPFENAEFPTAKMLEMLTAL